MTFSEMKTDVRRRLNEASATFWTDADIEEALNDALAEVADATEYYERQANLQMLDGRTYYDLTSLLPDTFLSPRRCWNATTQKWLTPTDPRELDYHTFVQWELTNGEPEKYWLRGNWWLGVFPRRTADTSKVRIYYTAIPPAMSASTDEPGFPREFHQAVTELALSDLLAQERETSKALQHWESGQEYVAALQLYVEGRQRLAGMRVI